MENNCSVRGRFRKLQHTGKHTRMREADRGKQGEKEQLLRELRSQKTHEHVRFVFSPFLIFIPKQKKSTHIFHLLYTIVNISSCLTVFTLSTLFPRCSTLSNRNRYFTEGEKIGKQTRKQSTWKWCKYGQKKTGEKNKWRTSLHNPL